MEEDYISLVYKKLVDIKRRARENNINLSSTYSRNSDGWKLQVEVDHLAANMHVDLLPMSNNYKRIDCCLEEMELMIGGDFYNKMQRRRERIKDKYEKVRRVNSVLDLLSD